MPAKNPRTKGEASVLIVISAIIGLGGVFGVAWLLGYSATDWVKR